MSSILHVYVSLPEHTHTLFFPTILTCDAYHSYSGEKFTSNYWLLWNNRLTGLNHFFVPFLWNCRHTHDTSTYTSRFSFARRHFLRTLYAVCVLACACVTKQLQIVSQIVYTHSHTRTLFIVRFHTIKNATQNIFQAYLKLYFTTSFKHLLMSDNFARSLCLGPFSSRQCLFCLDFFQDFLPWCRYHHRVRATFEKDRKNEEKNTHLYNYYADSCCVLCCTLYILNGGS